MWPISILIDIMVVLQSSLELGQLYEYLILIWSAMVTHSIYGLLQVEEGMIILGRLMEN